MVFACLVRVLSNAKLGIISWQKSQRIFAVDKDFSQIFTPTISKVVLPLLYNLLENLSACATRLRGSIDPKTSVSENFGHF